MAKAPTKAIRRSDSFSDAATVRQASYSMSSAVWLVLLLRLNSPILCNIEVHSLKLTGNEIFVKSLPTDDLRMLHTRGQLRHGTHYKSLTADRWSLVVIDRQSTPHMEVRL